MSKIKKALERGTALREQNIDAMALLDREQPALPQKKRLGLSEREQLENDIYALLRKEHPESLGRMKKQIKLSYTRTKVIQTDDKILRRNRVLATCKTHATTQKLEILRTQVLTKLQQMKVNSLMVTSANPGEGKTFISSNLAVSISQNFDRTVMLIDADLRDRYSARQDMASIFFNTNNLGGLSDYLSGKAHMEELLINPGIPRLTILPSGKTLCDSASCLGSPKMEELVQEMKTRYSTERILIFDSSSFMSSADALTMSRFVDAVLLVIENEKTELNTFQRMVQLLKDRVIIGAVVNKSMDRPNPT